MDLAGDPDRI